LKIFENIRIFLRALAPLKRRGGFFILKKVWIPTVKYCIMFIVFMTN